jgi:integrase/recombinase XerD
MTHIVAIEPTDSSTAVVAVWSGRSPARNADRSSAVDQLPGSASQDPYQRLVMAFLIGYPTNTARAYLSDLKAWGAWCTTAGVHPLDARRHHVDAWVRIMTAEPLPHTGKPRANASIARRLSCLSKFYDHAMSVEVVTYSPVANVRRPKVSDDSRTVGLDADELIRLLDVADAHSPRSSALVTLLAYNGVRIDEALSADIDDYTYQRGHRVLRIVRKGGKAATEPLAGVTVRALDAYIAERTIGPIFLDRTGTNRLVYATAFKLIQRLAKRAGIAAAASITPHSLRHTFVTEALAAGVPLQDVQDAAGHADPRTTRRYDRSRHNLDRHPTYILATHLRRNSTGNDVEEQP